MRAIEALREQIPEHSDDIAHNLAKVLGDSTLSASQMWGVALACALASRHADLTVAVRADARDAGVSADALDDAHAAASLMAMTNVYYRFKHFMADDAIDALPSRLRMKRTARPKGAKVDFELFCVAVSAIHGCEACVRHHAAAASAAGVSDVQLADSVRIAATIHAAAVALS